MEMKEFCEKVRGGLEITLGEEAAVTVNKITKNNGIVLNSVVIMRKERNISPNIYLDEFFEAFQRGMDFDEILDHVTGIYRDSSVAENMDIHFFMDYERMKQRVAYKMIGRDKNQELLKEIPHLIFLDMAVVFYCYVPEGRLDNATILIYNNHLDMWNISKEQLSEDAKENCRRLLPARILPIEKMMEEIFAADLQDEFSAELPADEELMPDGEWFDRAAGQMLSSVTEMAENDFMFVLGNEKKLFGAAAMLYDGVLQGFADKLKKNIFILPSSIHEVILLADDGEQEAESLWKMVCDINETQVDPEEVLTNAIYYYSRDCGEIVKLY